MAILTGYSGQVWSAVYAALAYYQTALTTAASPGATVTLSEAMLATLLNGVAAINANDMAAAWNVEQEQLGVVLTLPLTLDSMSLGFVEARLSSYEEGYAALAPLIPQPPYAPAGSIAAGVPVIPDMNLLGFYESFDFEVPYASGISLLWNDNGVVTITNHETAIDGPGTNLINDGGWLQLVGAQGYPTSESGLPPGAIWNNGQIVGVVPGAIPNPNALPVQYGQITAAQLLAMGGANLPTSPPATSLTGPNLPSTAALVSDAFSNLAQAVLVYQGVNLTSAYDIATREATITGIVATMLGDVTSGPFAQTSDILYSWNQVVVLPAMTILAKQLSGAPFLLQSQQSSVIRYTMLSLAQQVAQFLLILRQPETSQIALATLYVGETLMDVAARTLNNFERWTEIAAINGLSPPYVGPVSLPGIAGWGSQLILPTTGTQLSAAGDTPSYEANFLGTDVYLGPINGVMPPWTGDYQTITGYSNLRWALGRRLQTTLSTLIYHNNYGCRIPPEVGQVQGSTTAGNIVAYGKSALLSDGRVQSVVSATASGYPQGVDFKATVQPAGFGSQEAVVNEVITNLP